MEELTTNIVLDDLTFTSTRLAKLINCSRRSIREWIKGGYLPGKWDDERTKWTVSAKHVVRFLYFNPKYRRRLEANKLTGILGEQKRVILTAVYQKRPVMMDITDLAEKFSLSEDTIRCWVRRKNLRKSHSKFAIINRIYTVDAVKKFFDENPYYKKAYGAYLAYTEYLKGATLK